MAKANRIKTLADAAAASFEAAGFSPAELLQGPITLTDLPWQAPPLEVPALYWGVPFSDYLDYPLDVSAAELYEYYLQGLMLLHLAPQDISNENGYTDLARTLPGCTKGERQLALPLYASWPDVDSTTGPMFALEMARIFKTSAKGLKDFVKDESNYCAVTEWGNVGIVDGYVSDCRDMWDVDCSGMVQGMLEQPRGQVVTLCQYDMLARVRSALHQEPERFGDFELVDYALQALRILTYGDQCHELLTAISHMSTRAFKRKLKINTYQKALEIMKSWDLTDRVKVSMLQELLIPGYMSLTDFSRKIWNPYKVMPGVLSNKAEARILNYLNHVIKRAQDAEPVVKSR